VRKEGVSGDEGQGLMRDLVMAVADGFITFCWVFSGASVTVIANVLAKELGLGNAGKTSILVALALVVLPTFIAVGRWMGGASWNSVGLLALASLGVGHVTFVSVLIRLPAQACHLTKQTSKQSSSVVSGMLEHEKGFKIGVFASQV
jgi:drug/metabolite transporter (DMT)-like permease